MGLTPTEGVALTALAVTAIQDHLFGGTRLSVPPLHAALCIAGASFVTLETTGALRGCIGTLDAVRPLYADVTRNAVRALADPRMPPVTPEDWPWLDIAVSVLSAHEPVPAGSRAELIAALRPGLDGLLIEDGQRRATFLPVVWHKLNDPEAFLTALLVKGGWPENGWPVGLRAARYTTIEFHNRAPRTAT